MAYELNMYRACRASAIQQRDTAVGWPRPCNEHTPLLEMLTSQLYGQEAS